MGVKEIKVGLLSLIGLFVGYFGFNYLKGNSIFNKGEVFYSFYQDVEGLHVGSRVVVNGFPVGKVRNLTFQGSGGTMLMAEYVVNDETIVIPKNTTAEILATDVFGSKAINLKIGDSKELAQSGDTLESAEAVSFFAEIDERVKPYEIQLKSIMTNLDSVLAGFQVTIASVNEILEKEKKDVGAITTNVKSITNNLKKSNESITNTLANLESVSDSLNQADIKKVLDNANATILALNEVLEKVNNGDGTMGKLMNDSSLYVNLNQSMVDLDILLKDIHEQPYRYIYIRKTKEQKEAEKKAKQEAKNNK